MKQKLFSVLLLLLALNASAQFEQKASINFSMGVFKTLGDKTIVDHPKQMPWYIPGIAAEGGFQYNITGSFSILADIGIMYSPKWSCITDGYDWMSYEVWQDTTIMLSSGMNKLKLLNLSFSVKPKLYLVPGGKLKPFLFAGLSINYTKTPSEDNCWRDYVAYGLNEPGDEPYWPFMQKNFGFGFSPGIGIEYDPGDKMAFYFTSGGHFILINPENYPYDVREEIKGNLNAFHAEAGIRFSLIKSKDL